MFITFNDRPSFAVSYDNNRALSSDDEILYAASEGMVRSNFARRDLPYVVGKPQTETISLYNFIAKNHHKLLLTNIVLRIFQTAFLKPEIWFNELMGSHNSYIYFKISTYTHQGNNV